MIVVVGSPSARRTESGIAAAGMAVTIGRVAADTGAAVELIGKVGEGAIGDAALLSLARMGIGHVAVLRDASTPTPLGSEPDLDAETISGIPAETRPAEPGAGPTMDSDDLQLALRYLPDYRVVVVADPIDQPSLDTVAAAARWAGAALILVVASGMQIASIADDDATVLEAPPTDPDGAFARIVAAYAVALDGGAAPDAAFARGPSGAPAGLPSPTEAPASGPGDLIEEAGHPVTVRVAVGTRARTARARRSGRCSRAGSPARSEARSRRSARTGR